MDHHLRLREKAYEIIQSFPRSKNGQHFVTLHSRRKVFFSIFIKKYGLDGGSTKYNTKDVGRRVRQVEFFDYILKQFPISYDRTEKGRHYYVIETHFYRFVLLEVGRNKLELLSFYNRD